MNLHLKKKNTKTIKVLGIFGAKKHIKRFYMWTWKEVAPHPLVDLLRVVSFY